MTLTVETWIEALESGKYEQADGVLRHGDKHCCLGVACDISGIGEWDRNNDYRIGDAVYDKLLPKEIMHQLQLSSESGFFDPESLPAPLRAQIDKYCETDECSSMDLTDLNDNHVPFPLIAKVIRARPKGLFREEERS